MSNLKRAHIRLNLAKRVQKRVETGDCAGVAVDLLRILKDMSPDTFNTCKVDELPLEWETLSTVARCAFDMGLWHKQPTLQPHQLAWLSEFKRKWAIAFVNPNALVGDFLGAATTQTLTFV